MIQLKPRTVQLGHSSPREREGGKTEDRRSDEGMLVAGWKGRKAEDGEGLQKKAFFCGGLNSTKPTP